MKGKWISVALAVALVAVAFGAVSVQANIPAACYWSGDAAGGDWTVGSNWTGCTGTAGVPGPADWVYFDNSGTLTLTSVPAVAIYSLRVTNNTTVNLQAGAANTLSITSYLAVDSGSALNMNGATALTILLGVGATGSISGSMSCSVGLSKLNASDAGAITFNSGAVFTQGTGCTGNVFTNTGTANVIVFAAGSTFISQAGSNPFGLAQPNSKVVFQSGSLYRHEQSGTPSFSGRTYANFELNLATTINGTGGSPLTIDNLTVTNGTLNLGMTGTFNLKGNILVASGKTLSFSPASAATVTFSGTSQQTIGGAGTLTFAALQSVAINNASGVVLNCAVTFGGAVTVAAGASFDANGNAVTVTGTLANNGTLKQTLPVATSGSVGFFNTGNYGGVLLDAAGGGDLGSTLVTIRGNQAQCDSGNSTVHRCFDIAPANTSGVNATVTLYVGNAELNSLTCSALAMYHWSGAAWELAGTSGTPSCTTEPYSVQATGVTSFSPFALAAATPTAVTLGTLGASSPFGLLTVIPLVVVALAGGLVAWRRRRA